MNAVWYEAVRTVMSAYGATTFINFPADELPAGKDEQEWVKRAAERGEWPLVVHREAVARMLEGVDAKAVTEAKLAPETTDTAAPTTGTAKDKEAAVAAKLATVVPVAEWEKLEVLQATVVRDEKPAEDVKP